MNRRARGLARPGPLLDELRLSRAGAEVIETTSTSELEAAAPALATRAREGAVIVLAGGDGSHMAGVSALLGVVTRRRAAVGPIRFALAPGGTVGTVARNWGMRGDPVAYTRRLLDAIAADRFTISRRPTLRIGERVGFIFGAGLVGRFFDLYESRGAGGNLAAARIVARVFAGSFVGSRFARSILEPQPCALRVDGAPAPFDRLSLICASVVRDLGLGLRLVHRAGEELDRFHVVATPLGPRALGPQMPLVLAARPLLGPRVDTLARSIRLEFSSNGAYVLDGDLFRADVVDLEAGPPIDVVAS